MSYKITFLNHTPPMLCRGVTPCPCSVHSSVIHHPDQMMTGWGTSKNSSPPTIKTNCNWSCNASYSGSWMRPPWCLIFCRCSLSGLIKIRLVCKNQLQNWPIHLYYPPPPLNPPNSVHQVFPEQLKSVSIDAWFL